MLSYSGSSFFILFFLTQKPIKSPLQINIRSSTIGGQVQVITCKVAKKDQITGAYIR